MMILRKLSALIIITLIISECTVLDVPIVSSSYPNDYTFFGGVRTQNGVPIGRDQSTLVIYVRASDDTTTGLDALRTSEQSEFTSVNTFFLESSFNQTSFDYTHAPSTGWYQLPDTDDDYNWTSADITAASTPEDEAEARDRINTLQEASDFFTHSLQEALDDGFNVGNFDQVCVVQIGGFHRGQSFPVSNYTLQNNLGDDFQVNLPLIVVSTNTGWSRTAHEFGHAFGNWVDLYNAPSRNIDQWDIMDCTDCTNQTTGWHKSVKSNWYSGSQIKTITRPVGTTQIIDNTTLAPAEKQTPSSTDVQVIELKVGGDISLYIENRQTISGQVGSQSLPADGIIITDAFDDPNGIENIKLFRGPMTSGSTIVDHTYGRLEIEVSGTAPNLDVKTTWGPDPYYDLTINPWNPPPWESEDIWVDSEANGWDIYEYNDSSENPDIAGNPIRNGDRPWVGRVNRIYARVHNTGSTDAANVNVNILVNTPQGIGDAGNWRLLDRVLIPIVRAGDSEVVFVPWTPSTSNATHTCLLARIDPQSDELNENNNEAQENISSFNTSSASPWKKIEEELEIANPTDRYQDIRIEVRNIPRKWTVWVSDRIVPLKPKETKTIKYIIDPNGGNPEGNKSFEIGSEVDIHIEGYLANSDQYVRYGGITANIHAVNELQKIEIISTPQEGEFIDERMKPVVVSISPGEELQTTLEIININTKERNVIFSQSRSIDANQSIAEFDLFEALRQELVTLESGETYQIIALLYGNNQLGNAIESQPRFIQFR